MNHSFKLEFVDSGLYFFKDENNFIDSLLQVGSGSGSDERVSDPEGQNQRIRVRIRILIPAKESKNSTV